jgi:phage tail protein X
MTHPTVFRVALRGDELLNNPRFNKGTAFTVAERKEFGLTGRLPYQVNTLDEQCERAYLQLQGRDSAIRYAGLGLSKCGPCLNDHQQEFLPAEPEEPEHRLILHPSDEVRQMSAVFQKLFNDSLSQASTRAHVCAVCRSHLPFSQANPSDRLSIRRRRYDHIPRDLLVN